MKPSDWIGVASVLVATLGLFTTIIIAVLNKREKERIKELQEREARQEARAERRRQESVITLQWMSCMTVAMTEVSKPLKLLGANGELSSAIKDVVRCSDKIEDYLREVNAENNHS